MITERRNKKEAGIAEDGETVKFNLAVDVVLREVNIPMIFPLHSNDSEISQSSYDGSI